MINFRPTKAVINIDAIQHNVRALQAHLTTNPSIIAVVKANGYGHGDIEIAKAVIAAGVEMLAVATPNEAITLRQAGIESDILVLAPSPIQFATLAAKLRITVAVSSDQWLKEAIQQLDSEDPPLKIHMKIDGGMGRSGLREVETAQAIDAIVEKTDRIILDGAFMQFSNAADENRKRTEEQFSIFMNLVKALKKKPRLLHVNNSAGALLYPEYALDAVRIGISLYGISPSEYVKKHLPIPLKRAMSIETELSVVKKLSKGSTISYGGLYVTQEDEWIGTIPLGYADGLQRNLEGQEVLVGGERVPIVGAVCMDQCMIKLTKEMKVGESVMLIGKQGHDEITVEEWATRLNTIPYEIIVTISERIPRFYK